MKATITSIDQLDLSKRYTYADYLTWQFDEMVELIRGKIYPIGPSPRLREKQVAQALMFHFWSFIKGNSYKLYPAPFDVRLNTSGIYDGTESTVVQPEFCVVCDSSKLDDRGCAGAPDVIVEVLSPRTQKLDCNEKFNLYEENRVFEYWLVHPYAEAIEIYTLTEKSYKRYGLYDKYNTLIMGSLFPELVIEWKDVFDE